MAENVIAIHDAEAFQNKLKEAATHGKVIVVDFTATWCGPCKHITPHFAELSKKYPELIFLKVDVDELPTITSKWEVQAMPTFVFIKDHKEVDKLVGASKDLLEKKVKNFADQYKSSHTAAPAPAGHAAPGSHLAHA